MPQADTGSEFIISFLYIGLLGFHVHINHQCCPRITYTITVQQVGRYGSLVEPAVTLSDSIRGCPPRCKIICNTSIKLCGAGESSQDVPEIAAKDGRILRLFSALRNNTIPSLHTQSL
jgi:hypothetical protein